MRTVDDAVRSARRYIAGILGSPPWRVRLGMDGRFERPIGLVQLSAGTNYDHGGVDTTQVTAALTIQLYPEIGRYGSQSKALAERAADQLSRGLELGIPDPHDPTVQGYRERIPLWDYTDLEGRPLPLEGPGSVATRRLEKDYLDVVPGWRFITIPEAPEDQLFTSIGEISVRWYRNARTPEGGRPLRDVIIDVRGEVGA